MSKRRLAIREFYRKNGSHFASHWNAKNILISCRHPTFWNFGPNLEQLNRSTARINRATVREQRLATKRNHPGGRPGAQQPFDR